MGIVVKQGFKGAIVIYLGAAFGALNLLWIFPKYLNPEEIGLLRVLVDIGILFSILSQFGISNIADKFFGYFQDDHKKHHGFLFLLLLYSTIGFAIITIVYSITMPWWVSFYKNKSPLLLQYLYSIIPLALFIMYLSILEAYSRVHMKIVVPSIIREVFLRVAQSVVVVLYFLEYITLDWMVYLVIGSYLVGLVLIIVYLKKEKRFYLSIPNYLEKKGVIKEAVFFGLFIYLSAASSLIGAKIDVMMLSGYEGLFSTGVYSIAFFIGTMIEIPRRPISSIASPLIGRFWIENETDKIFDLYKKSALNQLIIGLLLFLLVWINVDDIFGLMPNSEVYKLGKYVILFIGISKVFDMATGLNAEIITYSPFYKINLFLSVFAGVSIIAFNYLLIPPFGMNGAALAILFNYMLQNIIRMVIVYKKLKMHPFSFNYFYVIIIATLVYIVVFLIPHFGDSGIVEILFNLSFKSIIITGMFLGLVFYFKLSLEFNQVVLKIFRLGK